MARTNKFGEKRASMLLIECEGIADVVKSVAGTAEDVLSAHGNIDVFELWFEKGYEMSVTVDDPV